MKVKLCDCVDLGKVAWVNVRGTVCNLFITRRQYLAAKRRAGLSSRRWMEIAFDSDNESFIDSHRGGVVNVLATDGSVVDQLKIY